MWIFVWSLSVRVCGENMSVMLKNVCGDGDDHHYYHHHHHHHYQVVTGCGRICVWRHEGWDSTASFNQRLHQLAVACALSDTPCDIFGFVLRCFLPSCVYLGQTLWTRVLPHWLPFLLREGLKNGFFLAFAIKRRPPPFHSTFTPLFSFANESYLYETDFTSGPSQNYHSKSSYNHI